MVGGRRTEDESWLKRNLASIVTWILLFAGGAVALGAHQAVVSQIDSRSKDNTAELKDKADRAAVEANTAAVDKSREAVGEIKGDLKVIRAEQASQRNLVEEALREQRTTRDAVVRVEALIRRNGRHE